MDLELLLSRLDKVKSSGADKYIACCPAHDDKTPSLSIRQANDRVLIHCFAGCGANDILDSIGLDYDTLYTEERNTQPVKQYGQPKATDDIYIQVYKFKVKNGDIPTQQDTANYRDAVKRRHF
jgi:DNA primase